MGDLAGVADPAYHLKYAARLDEGWDRLDRGAIDAVLLDED